MKNIRLLLILMIFVCSSTFAVSYERLRGIFSRAGKDVEKYLVKENGRKVIKLAFKLHLNPASRSYHPACFDRADLLYEVIIAPQETESSSSGAEENWVIEKDDIGGIKAISGDLHISSLNEILLDSDYELVEPESLRAASSMGINNSALDLDDFVVVKKEEEEEVGGPDAASGNAAVLLGLSERS